MNRNNVLLKKYEIVSVHGKPCNLGFGAYGSVMLGNCLKTGVTVAIKKINRKLAVNQVSAHLKLSHPNIIGMLDYFFDEETQTTYIVLQYAENGTLFDYIQEKGMKDKRMIRGVFTSVCDAMEYMHSKNMMHRDLKPENILLDRKNNIKLCDFGFAVICETRTTICGTVEYMAPEMILRKPYTYKIDVWGLGILLFELICGRPPFPGNTQEEVLQKMKKPIPFTSDFTKDEIDLIQRILRINPNQRLEIKDILKSPCLRCSREFEESSQRSTAEQEKESSKKIKILQVKDLHETPERKEIKITSIRQIGNGQQSTMNSSAMGSSTMFPMKGQKISLRKALRKN